MMVLAALSRDAATGQVTPVNTTTQQDANGTMITGDTLFTAFTKVNGSLLFLGVLASNNVAALNTVSNAVNAMQYGALSNNFVLVSNNFTVVSNAWAAFTATSSTILRSGGAMAFDQRAAAPYAMQITSDGNGNMTVGGGLTVNGSIVGTYLVDSDNDTPAAGMVATSVGTDGTWQWVTPPAFPTTLNLDSGNITSDGSGDASFVSIYAQQLKDSGGGTGSAGSFAQANGSGGWAWTAWPTTLSYDSGAIYSDSSGDLYATILKAELWDNGYSTGSSGYIPTANGDGTWTWTAWPTTLNYDSGNVVSDGSGDVTAVSVQAQLWDSTSSSGGSGQVATAQGDGTWLWQTASAMAAAAGGDGGNIVTNAAGARFALVVNAQTNGFIFVPQ